MHRYRLKSLVNNKFHHKTSTDKNWFYSWGIMLFFGASVACGFVYVSWQHIEAMRLGYETEQMKQQIRVLTQRQRQLSLEKQRRLSPSVIETLAQQQGIQLPRSEQTISISTN